MAARKRRETVGRETGFSHGGEQAGFPQAPKTLGRVDLFIAVGLCLITLVVYAQLFTHQFLNYDDDNYIWANPIVIDGLTPKGISWAFATFHSASWHPLTWLSLMLDSELFGLNAGPRLLVNAVLHTANTFLLFLFLKQVTGATWRSAIVAAFFALHPLHVESVAWACERKDTLSTFFGLLCLLSYVRYVAKPSGWRYIAVASWLALGLMAKAMLVSWPFLLLLLDYWPFRRLEWQPADGVRRFAKAWLPLVREKLPLFCIAAVSMVLTYIAQVRWGGVAELSEVSLPWRLAHSLVSYGKYLLLTFWPHGLVIYYPSSPAVAPVWQWGAALILLATITAVSLRTARNRPYLIVGWFWFIGMLVPVIGLVRAGDQAIADHFTYFPLIGLFIALVFGLADLARLWHPGRLILAITAGGIILLLAILTTVQVSRWRDSETLYEYVLSVSPENPVAQNNLGSALGQRGKHAEALSHFAEALRIRPNYFDALANLGQALLEQGQAAEAVGLFRRALRVKPGSAKTHWQLGVALEGQGRNVEAMQQFQETVRLAPQDPAMHANLGTKLFDQGKFLEAAEQYDQALRLDPNNAEMHNNFGLVLFALDREEEGLREFSTAIRLKPDLAAARENLRRAQERLQK